MFWLWPWGLHWLTDWVKQKTIKKGLNYSCLVIAPALLKLKLKVNLAKLGFTELEDIDKLMFSHIMARFLWEDITQSYSTVKLSKCSLQKECNMVDKADNATATWHCKRQEYTTSNDQWRCQEVAFFLNLGKSPIIKTKLVLPPPSPARATPTVNSLASSLPERSTETVPFYPAPIRDWNSLSKDAVEVMTVDTFVSRASLLLVVVSFFLFFVCF